MNLEILNPLEESYTPAKVETKNPALTGDRSFPSANQFDALDRLAEGNRLLEYNIELMSDLLLREDLFN